MARDDRPAGSSRRDRARVIAGFTSTGDDSHNLFGTTYYSLVGLHASHLIFGLVALTLVMAFSWLGYLRREHAEHTHLLAMYWHFVDWVWVIVFTVVYIIGR